MLPIAAGLMMNDCLNWSTDGAETFGSALSLMFAAVFTIFVWLGLGWLLFPIGFAALLSMVILYFLYLRDDLGRRGYLGIFTSAVIYYAPYSLYDREGNFGWGWAELAGAYAVISAVYWYAPSAISRFRACGGVTPETGGLPPKTAFQQAWEKQSSYGNGEVTKPPA